jgi:hypothetical protein
MRSVSPACANTDETTSPSFCGQIEHTARAAEVELSKRVVQQQQRSVAKRIAERGEFEQAQGNRRTALLPRRTERTQIPPAEMEMQVVAMRPYEGDAATQFRTALRGERPRERVRLHEAARTLGLAVVAPNGAVAQHCPHALADGGAQLRISLGMLAHEAVPGSGHDATILGEGRLPHLDARLVIAASALPLCGAQRRIAPQQCGTILLQRLQVRRRGQREHHVEVAAAVTGATGHERHIRG